MSSSMNKKEEGSRGAPIPDRWYSLKLGSSFKDHQPSSKFCTLRYEFKPASVDKTQPGTLHKSKDNKISVEFHNNQHGKPKVTFEGSSEDYKENDAVLFFDGQSFRLERLHRAFKRLRHVRLPGESSSSAVLPTSAAASDTGSPPLAKVPKAQPPPPPPPQSQGFNSRNSFAAPPPPPPPLRGPVSVEVERIDIGDAGNSGGKSKIEKSISTPQPSNSMASPDLKDFDLEEHLDIMIDDDDDALGPSKDNDEEKAAHTGININMPQQNDTDDEIADVDVNDDNGVNGSTAAAALRAQVNAVERKEATSSSSTSSGSESSGSSSESGSGSSRSSSDSESSEGDSVNSI